MTDGLRQHYGLEAAAAEADVLAAVAAAPPLIVIDNAEDVPLESDARREYGQLIGKLKARGAPMLLTARGVAGTETAP